MLPGCDRLLRSYGVPPANRGRSERARAAGSAGRMKERVTFDAARERPMLATRGLLESRTPQTPNIIPLERR